VEDAHSIEHGTMCNLVPPTTNIGFVDLPTIFVTTRVIRCAAAKLEAGEKADVTVKRLAIKNA